MTDTLGFGAEKRRQYNRDVLDEKLHFRDSFREMLGSISERHTFDDGVAAVKKCKFTHGFNFSSLVESTNLDLYLAAIQLDPGFKDFFGRSQI
jgi:2-hydroxy-3-keto-5-methylthiopentenyl-1-phosphate phosphatase